MKITITIDGNDVVVDLTDVPAVGGGSGRLPTHDEFEDAARYRYIRKGEYTLSEERHWNPGAVSHGMAIRIGSDLDERIDEARFGEIPE